MRLFRRLLLVLLVLAATISIAGGAALIFRSSLAETLLLRALADRGIDAQLQISKLGWNETIIENFSAEELQIEKLRISYALRELLRGQIIAADLQGLDLRIDLTGNGPALGSLQSLLSDASEPTAPAQQTAPLPSLLLQDAQISVLLANGEVDLTVFGALTPDEDGSAIALNFETLAGMLLASGEMRAQLTGTSLSSLVLDANIRDEEGGFSFVAQAMSNAPDFNRPEVNFSVQGEGGIVPLARYIALNDSEMPQTGSFRLNTNGRITLPMGGASAIALAQGEMIFELALSDVSLLDYAALPEGMRDGLNAEASGMLSLHRGSLQVGLGAAIDYANRPATFVLSAPAVTAMISDNYALNNFDLNEFVLSVNEIPTPYGTLRNATVDGALTGLTSGPSGTMRIHAALPVFEIASATARGAVVELNVALQPTENGYRLTQSDPGRMTAASLILPAILPIDGFSGQINSASVELTAQEAGYSFTQLAQISLPALSLKIARQDAEPVALNFESGPLRVESAGAAGGDVRFDVASNIDRLAFPDFGMVSQNAALNIDGIAGGEIIAAFHGGSITHAVENPFITPLTPDLRLVQNGDNLSFSGTLKGAGDQLTIAVQGGHNLAMSAGAVSFLVDDLEFGPQGASGAAISSLFASMQNLRGNVNGEANFSWDSESFKNGARINIPQLAFRRDTMMFEGLSAELTLDRLLPARSPPGQELAIARIETGLEDVTQLRLTFRLDTNENGTPRIYTESLGMNIAGGRISAEGGSFDPMTGESTIPLRAENLDLARLLSHIGLEELTGVGQLNGSIPFTMSAAGASIEGATLNAIAPGIVAYRSPRAREALASGGDSVKLMLDALEDFHYDDLSLTMSKPVAGDTAITLRMQGNNPAVLDGNPFDLNISLTGDADPLLQALLAGQRLSNDMIRSITDR